jgi:hypothetical protein
MKSLLIFFTLALPFCVFAQVEPSAEKPKTKVIVAKKILPAWCVDAGYGAHLTAGDMANRYGAANYLHGGLHYKTNKLWFYGIDGGYFFGQETKEDPLSILRTPDGHILGKDREYARISMDERGFLIGALVGKIIPLSQKLPESGIRTSLTVGYMQHSLRIQDDAGQVPALADNYKMGYDRLTGGVHVTEFLGYQIVDTKGYINFFGGLESTQGFTRSLRIWQTDLRRNDTSSRVDVLFTARVGITLAIRKRKANEIYY